MIRKAAAALMCATGLVASATGVVGAQPSNHAANGVFRFSDGGAVATGAARLVTNDAGATVSVRTAELAAEPHTAWWVVFNHPEHCTDPFAGGFQCGPGDLPFLGGHRDVEFSLLYAAGNGRSGHAGFGAGSAPRHHRCVHGPRTGQPPRRGDPSGDPHARTDHPAHGGTAAPYVGTVRRQHRPLLLAATARRTLAFVG
jgi:hypothetical protein